MVGGNALQVQVAADFAMSVKVDAKRPGAGVKAGFAGRATPGQPASNAVEIIACRPSPRTARVVLVANRTTGVAGAGHKLPIIRIYEENADFAKTIYT